MLNNGVRKRRSVRRPAKLGSRDASVEASPGGDEQHEVPAEAVNVRHGDQRKQRDAIIDRDEAERSQSGYERSAPVAAHGDWSGPASKPWLLLRCRTVLQWRWSPVTADGEWSVERRRQRSG